MQRWQFGTYSPLLFRGRLSAHLSNRSTVCGLYGKGLCRYVLPDAAHSFFLKKKNKKKTKTFILHNHVTAFEFDHFHAALQAIISFHSFFKSVK